MHKLLKGRIRVAQTCWVMVLPPPRAERDKNGMRVPSRVNPQNAGRTADPRRQPPPGTNATEDVLPPPAPPPRRGQPTGEEDPKAHREEDQKGDDDGHEEDGEIMGSRNRLCILLMCGCILLMIKIQD